MNSVMVTTMIVMVRSTKSSNGSDKNVELDKVRAEDEENGAVLRLAMRPSAVPERAHPVTKSATIWITIVMDGLMKVFSVPATQSEVNVKPVLAGAATVDGVVARVARSQVMSHVMGAMMIVMVKSMKNW